MKHFTFWFISSVLASASAWNNPTSEWETVAPEDAGFDPEKLKTAIDYAGKHVGGSRSHCVSVHRNGKLVAEKYWLSTKGKANIAWSVSKAFTSTLIGIAEKAGAISAEQAATDFIPEWLNATQIGGDGDPADIIIDHLMRHDSGRYYDLVTDFVRSQLQPSQTEYAISLRQQNKPGAKYQYNQMAIQTLERVITKAVGMSVNDFADKVLFAAINAQHSPYFSSDSVVTSVVDGLPSENEDPLMYGGVTLSCRDLARFGQLWLQRGVWSGEQIFEDTFYERGVNKHPDPARAGEGYHWGGKSSITATGMGGQFVNFSPEKDLVITRLGGPLGTTWNPGKFRDMVMESLTDGVGSFDPVKDAIVPYEEEQQFIELLRAAGVEEKFAN